MLLNQRVPKPGKQEDHSPVPMNLRAYSTVHVMVTANWPLPAPLASCVFGGLGCGAGDAVIAARAGMARLRSMSW